jgi:autotransporter-associated beta strand protein
VPTGTATFDNTGLTQSLNISANASINTMLFAAGAPAYSFAINSSVRFDIVGAGIINNSSNAPTFSLTSISILAFSNNSTAGNAVIANNGFNSVTTFSNSSTAGTATITNTSFGSTTFNNTSTAGNATITSALSGFASFLGTSTAGNATITTNFGGSTFFNSNTTAGNATVVTNNGGSTQFSAFSTGGNAAFTTQAGGVFDMSALIAPGMTAGSIAGGGSYLLGSKVLVVGGNNLSTEVSGTVADGGLAGGTGGSLVKVGFGVLTLSGTNAYTGSTIVNSGALVVNGSIAPSSLTTVNSGAILLGSGTVGSTVVNAGGVLVPGPVGAPGMMTVAGDLTIDRNAFYVVQVNPLTASSINVSGTASLDGTVAAVFTPGIYLRSSYTILTADNRRTGRFEDLETFGLPRNFRARLDYFDNSVELNLRAQLIPGLFPGRPTSLPAIPELPLPPEDLPDSALPPFTVTQINVGRAVDNFFNNGGTLPPAFVSLYGLSGGNLTAALDQLSGEAATGAQKVGFQMESTST